MHIQTNIAGRASTLALCRLLPLLLGASMAAISFSRSNVND
ncbi:MAG: hypothetical protein WBA83_05040 [Burkholderiaceae bacterium]